MSGLLSIDLQRKSSKDDLQLAYSFQLNKQNDWMEKALITDDPADWDQVILCHEILHGIIGKKK